MTRRSTKELQTPSEPLAVRERSLAVFQRKCPMTRRSTKELETPSELLAVKEGSCWRLATRVHA